jgi:hypothetical protein
VEAPEPNPELLKSLGRLVRGLSALFWGLPIALIVCFHAARSDTLRTLGALPPVLCNAWLFYGLWQLGDFQKQERVWLNALDRAKFLSLVLLGLSPFLYWWNKIPDNAFFLSMVILISFCGLIFLATLNLVLQRLGAMLPDEALRIEINQFTALNLNLLAAMLLVTVLSFGLVNVSYDALPAWLREVRLIMDRASVWVIIPLLLLPLAMTMALIWKTKEVILDSVFNRHV